MIITLLVCLVVYVWYLWGDSLKRISPIVKITVGFILGTASGLGLSEFAAPDTVRKVVPYVAPFGELLLMMLKMVVFPIVLFSLMHGAAALPNRRMRQIGGKMTLWYVGTSVFATVLGVILAVDLNPTLGNAAHVAAPSLKAAEELSASATSGVFGEFLLTVFQNPFSALSNGQSLAIIVFSIVFGTAARKILDAARPNSAVAKAVTATLSAIDGARLVSFRMFDFVTHYFPVGVFALSAVNFAEHGVVLFGPYAKIVLCVIAGIAVMMFAVYPFLIFFTCRENPYRILLRFREPILTAFVTRSSVATLPVSLRTMDALEVDRAISGFSIPLGATVNMDGVCLHLPIFAVLAANIFGHPLAAFDIATICFAVVLASIGAGGIPGGSVLLLFMVLEKLGLPHDQILLSVALCLAVNPILDMFETCCNVTGDLVCTYIVSRRSGFALYREIEAAKKQILADGRIDFAESGRLLELVRPYVRSGDVHAAKLERLLTDVRQDGKIDSVESDLMKGLLDLISERFSDLKPDVRV